MRDVERKDMRITQGLRRALQVNADGVATICGTRRHTYRVFVDRVRRLAGALAELGVKPRDRVATLSLNSDRYLEYFFACWTLGAVAVPVNTRWSPREQIDSLQDSGASLLLLDENFVAVNEQIRAACPDIREAIFIGEGATPPNTRAYEEIVAAAKPANDAGFGGNDLAAIYYTGGTTGRSKGVMITHRNFVFNSVNYTATVPFDEKLHWLHGAPMFHVADANGILTTTLHGGTHSFLPSFDVERALAVIQNNRVNFCLFVPTMISMIVNHPAVGRYDVSHPVRCQFGGSPMPEAVLRRAMQVLPSWTFINGYGMTELSPFLTGFRLTADMAGGANAHLLKCCGTAAIGSEVRVVGEKGESLPPGEIGELLVRGDNVMLGYWNRPAETAAALRDGWLHTGDLARMDEQGRLYIVDRLKDMIITGGENVYPTEVEQIIYQLPDVIECAVVGLPDEKWGERVHAVVRCAPNSKLTAEALIAHCRQHLGSYKVPRGVTFRDEPLPLTGPGKIRKSELRAALTRNMGLR
jgi:acyl-CoA synthetase (AMP-forming)/AMP-acid ligase II